MNTDKVLASWKRELFDEIMLDMSETAKFKQDAVIAGYHEAGVHLAHDGNEDYLCERKPDRTHAPKRVLTEAQIREWADCFVLGYIGRLHIEEERKKDG
jgi:hypothetical protein